MSKLYLVTEHRMLRAEYLIRADDAVEAGLLNGKVIDASESDSWSYELLDVEETEQEELL